MYKNQITITFYIVVKLTHNISKFGYHQSLQNSKFNVVNTLKILDEGCPIFQKTIRIFLVWSDRPRKFAEYLISGYHFAWWENLKLGVFKVVKLTPFPAKIQIYFDRARKYDEYLITGYNFAEWESLEPGALKVAKLTPFQAKLSIFTPSKIIIKFKVRG